MTNGTSQALYIMVAVIIFGVFVLIAYALFQDKLQEGLGDIFTDVIMQTKEDLENKTMSSYLIEQNNLRFRNPNGEAWASNIIEPQILEDSRDRLEILYDVIFPSTVGHGENIYMIKQPTTAGIVFGDSRFTEFSTDNENWSNLRGQNITVLPFQAGRLTSMIYNYQYYLRDSKGKTYELKVTLDATNDYKRT